MSKCRRVEITCPKCNEKGSFTLWDSINVNVNPELKEKVKTGEVFEYVCKNCNEKSAIEYITLYNDCTNNFMIWYFPEGRENNINNVVAMDVPYGGRLRIVKNKRYNLVEKIKIFEDGLDDVTVEIMKSIVFDNLTREKQDDSIDIVYSKLENDNIYFSISNGKGAMVPYKMYEEIYSEHSGEHLKGFVYIDRKNVFEYIK